MKCRVMKSVIIVISLLALVTGCASENSIEIESLSHYPFNEAATQIGGNKQFSLLVDKNECFIIDKRKQPPLKMKTDCDIKILDNNVASVIAKSTIGKKK